jgi:hypothetical protein
LGKKMTTVSAVATKVRIATAASAIVAAATLAPAAVAYASPAAPLPQQTGLGSTLAGLLGSTLAAGNVTACDPAVTVCIPRVGATIGDSPTPAPQTPIIASPAVWLGSPANPNFQPFIGIAFPNFFQSDFEACFLGAAVHLSSYPDKAQGGFVGLGLGC